MAFVRNTQSNLLGSSSPVDGGPKVDSSQISKIEGAGYSVTPVSTNPQVLSNTTPKNVVLGTSLVPAYQDSVGNVFVRDEKNVIYNVKPDVTTLPTTGKDIPTGGGGINPPPRTDPGFPPVVPPTVPPSVPSVPSFPPNNLGSGRIYTRFDIGDIVPNEQETITRGLWSNCAGNLGNLTTFFTSSAQTDTSKRYYYNVYNSSSGACGSELQFSVAWGHKNGSGSADEGGQVNDSPSRAIYSQWKQLCLPASQERFTFNGTTTDQIYVVNVARARMRERIDEGNFEINLQRLSGSQWLAGGRPQNAWTGSNVRVFPTQAVLRLIDDSTVAAATITEAGEVYNIVSGTIEDGIYNSSAPHYYGQLFPRLGVAVLDGNRLDMSCSFLTVTGSEIPGDNAWKLYTSISGAALYTDASGDYLGIQGRSSERVKSTHFFVRAKNQEYNFSNNPSFVTGSEGDLAHPTMIGDPQTYITGVGLYNDNKELLAVAKVSRPIRKNYKREALVKVRLDF